MNRLEGFLNRQWCCVLTRRATTSLGGLFVLYTIQIVTCFAGLLLWFLHGLDIISIVSGATLFSIGLTINFLILTPVGDYFLSSSLNGSTTDCSFRWYFLVVGIISVIMAVFSIGFIADAWNVRGGFSKYWITQIDRLSTLLAVIFVTYSVQHVLAFRFNRVAMPFLLAFSIIVTNSTFALFYIPVVQHYVICAAGVAVMLFTNITFLIQFIFGKLKKWKLHFTIVVVALWQVAAVCVACNTIAKWNATIDVDYQSLTIERNVFYMVQTFPTVVALAALFVFVLYQIVSVCMWIPWCCRRCVDSVRYEVHEAKQIAENEAKKDTETTLKGYQSV